MALVDYNGAIVIMTPNGGATNQLLIFVREYGTTEFKNVVLQTKTKLAFDGQVKSLFGVGAYTVTVLDNIPSSFPSIGDQEIATLNNGANLEVKFANKVYNLMIYDYFSEQYRYNNKITIITKYNKYNKLIFT